MFSAKQRNLFEPKSLPMDLDFQSVIGELRILEEMFISRQDIERLADSQTSFHERSDIITKAGYVVRTSLEDAVLAKRDQVDLELKKYAGETLLADFLLLDLDYHNVKAILRYLILELHQLRDDTQGLANLEQLLYDKQDVLPSALAEMIRFTAPTDPIVLFQVILQLVLHKEKDVTILSDAYEIRDLFCEHVKKIVEKSSKGTNLAETDWLADQLCFEEMFQLSKDKSLDTMRPMLRDYIVMQAEHANFESYLRFALANRSYSTFPLVFVPHGVTSLESFESVFSAKEQIEELFKASPISEVYESFPKYDDKVSIARFGYHKDMFYNKIIRQGKYENHHAIALISYWLAKRMEQKNLRIIFQAVGRGTDKASILELIRPTYEEASL